MPLARVPGHSGPLPGLVLLAVAILPRPAVDRRPQDPELVSGKPVVIELDGTERALLVTAGLEGRCHLWASSEVLDPRLRLLSESGDELAVDEDGGGGTTAFLDFPVGPGASFVVLVEAQDGGSGRVVVQRADGLETPASIAASQGARAALANARQLLGEGRSAEACARIDAARSELEAVLDEVDSLSAAGELWQLGVLAGQAGDIGLVEACLEPVLALRERTLPPGHLERLAARFNVDWLIHLSGDSRRARERFVATLEECRRLRGERDLLVARMAITLSFLHWRVGRSDLAWDLLLPAERRLAEELPEDDVDRVWAALQHARLLAERGELEASAEQYEHLAHLTDPARGPGDPNRGWILLGWSDILRELGHLDRARELGEAVLQDRLSSLPPDHPDVLWAEIGLGAVLSDQGHHDQALALNEHVVAVRERILPPDHIDLLDAQAALAATCFQLGDLRRACELQETVLANLPPDLPPDNRTRLVAQTNLSLTLSALGESRRPVALAEEALALLERTRGPDDPQLRRARQNASIALFDVGQLERSRALAGRALEAAERTLGEDHLDLLSARANMASVLHGLGDYASQRDLLEQVVESASRVLPADSLDLARYRVQLGHAWRHLGELDRAMDLLRLVLDTARSRYGEGHRVALQARGELGQVYWGTRRYAELVPMLEQELELRRGGRGDSRDTQNARVRLAFALAATGELRRAEALLADVLAEREVELPEGSTLILDPLLGLTGIAAAEGHDERAIELGQRMLDGVLEDLSNNTLALSSQEIELFALNRERYLSTCMSLARMDDETPRVEALRERIFTLVESLRGIGMTEARLLGQAAQDPRLDELRRQARRTSQELVALAQGEGSRDELSAARQERDGALRDLLAHVRSAGAAQALLEAPTSRALAARLGPGAAAVGYVGYTWRGRDRGSWVLGGERHLAAHVLRPDGALDSVDLGPRAAIDEAVSAWRDALRAARERGVGVGVEDAEQGQRARGEALRRLVFDPLRAHLGDASRLVVALDDVLHSVPLDALPDGEALLGDSFTFVLRPTLRELAWPPREPPAGGLVALGGASFNSRPAEPDEAPTTEGTRGSTWDRGFPPLPYTSSEVQGIAALYEEVLESSAAARVLLGREATREGVERAAPGARWLHLATHGWFSPESVRGIEEALAVDAALGIEIGVSREERIRASSPMVLCGLALAGANLPADEVGRLPGVLTAEEVATWDLATCDLAVLSACDTNVGVQRSGQGVASLQKALHMAGARSVVTSLWKVPDEATQELMLEFYRRLWALGEPKTTALWRAKQKLRQARDPQGHPRYSTRDWAAWVLTGDPD